MQNDCGCLNMVERESFEDETRYECDYCGKTIWRKRVNNLPDGCSQSDIDAFFDGECPDCGAILREHFDGYSYCPGCGYVDDDTDIEELDCDE